MMHGRTPFFDKNRKLMFYRIINREPSFPPTFSPAACDCIRGLLRVNETERLGCGPRSAQEIMSTAFFSTVDFVALYRREIKPPFEPEVVSEFDTKYVSKAHLSMDVHDVAEEQPKRGGDRRSMAGFESFTFAGDKS
jgi:serine/threonine protein kinase